MQYNARCQRCGPTTHKQQQSFRPIDIAVFYDVLLYDIQVYALLFPYSAAWRPVSFVKFTNSIFHQRNLNCKQTWFNYNRYLYCLVPRPQQHKTQSNHHPLVLRYARMHKIAGLSMPHARLMAKAYFPPLSHAPQQRKLERRPQPSPMPRSTLARCVERPSSIACCGSSHRSRRAWCFVVVVVVSSPPPCSLFRSG